MLVLNVFRQKHSTQTLIVGTNVILVIIYLARVRKSHKSINAITREIFRFSDKSRAVQVENVTNFVLVNYWDMEMFRDFFAIKEVLHLQS